MAQLTKLKGKAIIEKTFRNLNNTVQGKEGTLQELSRRVEKICNLMDTEEYSNILDSLELAEFQKYFDLVGQMTEVLNLPEKEEYKDKEIISYDDICSKIDSEIQQLVMLAIPNLEQLQQVVSEALNIAGNICLDYNKAYFLWMPGLIGKGLKKGAAALIELDIPSLAGNIVFAKSVFDSLLKKYVDDNKKSNYELYDSLLQQLSVENRMDVKRFLQNYDEDYQKKVEINIDELNELVLPGYFYDEKKKKFEIKSPGFTPGNLLKFNLLKDEGFASYGLNLFKDQILEIDLGTNLGKGFSIGNMFNVNLPNQDEAAKELDLALLGLGDFFNREAMKEWAKYCLTARKNQEASDLSFGDIFNKDAMSQCGNHWLNVLKEFEVSDFTTLSTENTKVSVGGTINKNNITETVGVETVLSENKDTKVTLTNAATTKQGWGGNSTGFEFKTGINKKSKDSAINSVFKFSSENDEKSFIAAFGLSLCLSKLQNKPYITSQEALLNFGITYSGPNIVPIDDNHVSIKTTLNVGDSKSDFNLGFQIDTSKPENNKMIITYSFKGL